MVLSFTVWAVDARIDQKTDQKFDNFEQKLYKGLDNREFQYLYMKKQIKPLNSDEEIRYNYLLEQKKEH